MPPWSIPSPPINGFSLGPLTIRFYALCLIAGMFVAWWLGGRRWRARGGTADTFDTIVLWAVPLGIVGARIYHVLTHWGDYFAPGVDPLSVFRIWEGGIAMFGSIMGGALGAYIATRRTRSSLPAFADALAPGLIFAQALGRLGNWFNQELFGGPDDGPLGLEIDRIHRPPGFEQYETFQPTFLYEMAWNTAGGVVLLALDHRLKLGHGKLFALYLVIYGTGRFFIEAIRTDPSYMLGPLRTNQVTALVVALVGAAGFAWLARTRPGREEFVEESARPA
jgi:prolipoprotein diacylglyceryl transferase